MSLTAFRIRQIAWVGGGAAVVAATVTWWLRRSAEPRVAVEPLPAVTEGVRPRALPPTWSRLETEPESSPRISARPSVRHDSPSSPDDYDALSPEDLGAAFLAGATDTALDEPPSSIAEIQGFRIFDREESDEAPDDGLMAIDPSVVRES